MQMYGPRQGSRTLPWAKCQIFLEALFIPKQTQTPLIKAEKIFHLVFIEMQIYGPRQDSRTLPWAKCQIFLEALFIPKQTQTPLIKVEKSFI